ncbi:MAG: hypothetical protein EBR30_29760 [Cytophagia bacterium]|nr:hypothetical protein [Cytophagia bacterium]
MQYDNTNDLQVMIARVEDFIFDRTGKRVKIVFNNMARFPQHFEMLVRAHEYVLNYKNTKS